MSQKELENVLAGLGAETVHVEMKEPGRACAMLTLDGGKEIFVEYTANDMHYEIDSDQERDEETDELVNRLEDTKHIVLAILSKPAK